MSKLSKKQFSDQMNLLLTFFPSWNVDLSNKTTAKSWYQQFENCSDREFSKMVQLYIEKDSFPPTVAGLKKYWEKEQQKPLDQLEWERVLSDQQKALRQQGGSDSVQRTP